jgi:hypothetical protein
VWTGRIRLPLLLTARSNSTLPFNGDGGGVASSSFVQRRLAKHWAKASDREIASVSDLGSVGASARATKAGAAYNGAEIR